MAQTKEDVIYPLDARSTQYEDEKVIWEGDVKMGTHSSRKPKDDRHIKICGLWLHVYRTKYKERPPQESYHHLDLVTIANTSEELVMLTYKKPNNPQKTLRIKLLSSSIIGAVQALRSALKSIHCGGPEMNYVALCLSPAWLEKTAPEDQGELTVTSGVSLAYRAQCSYRNALWTSIFGEYVDLMATNGQLDFDLSNCPGVASCSAGSSRSSAAYGNAVTNIPLAIAALTDDAHFNTLVLRDVESPGTVNAVGSLLASNRTVTKIILENISSSGSHALDSWIKTWKLSAVQVLSFANTRLPSSSFIEFAHALGNCEVPLQTLDLTNCHLNNKAVLALLDAIYDNVVLTASLKQLSLSGNSFNAVCWNKFILWLDTYGSELPLRSLAIADTNAPLVSLLPVLTAICNTARLDISRNTFAPGKTGEKLDTIPQAMRALTYCSASNVGIAPAAVESFVSSFWNNRSEAAGPMTLDLSNNALGVEGGNALARVFGFMKHVNELNLSHNKIPCAQLVEMLLALRDADCIEKLYIADNVGYGSDKEAVRFMQEMMSFCDAHPNLKVLDISTHAKPPKGVLEGFLNKLGQNKTLTSLDISGYRIGDAGAVTLAKALSMNTTLTQLAYDRNEITVTGWQCLAHVLERNPTMQHMQLPREDYRGQLASFAKNTLAFSKLVQSQSDISRFCLRNYEANHTEPVEPSTCILDVPAPSSSYSKPAPIKKAERSPAHQVPSVTVEETGGGDPPEEEEPEPEPTISTISLANSDRFDKADSDKEDSEKIDEDDYDGGGANNNAGRSNDDDDAHDSNEASDDDDEPPPAPPPRD